MGKHFEKKRNPNTPLSGNVPEKLPTPEAGQGYKHHVNAQTGNFGVRHVLPFAKMGVAREVRVSQHDGHLEQVLLVLRVRGQEQEDMLISESELERELMSESELKLVSESASTGFGRLFLFCLSFSALLRYR